MVACCKLELTYTFDVKNLFIQIMENMCRSKIHTGGNEKQKITEYGPHTANYVQIFYW